MLLSIKIIFAHSDFVTNHLKKIYNSIYSRQNIKLLIKLLMGEIEYTDRIYLMMPHFVISETRLRL